MLQAINLGIRRGNRVLFEDSNFQVHQGHKVGITGRNGCGKSSLFALITGELHADSGDLEFPGSWRIAHVSQQLPAHGQIAIEHVLDGDTELRSIERQLAEAEHDHDGERIAELHSRLDDIAGYSARSRAAALLSGLGFREHTHDNPVETFSGGWLMRLNLAHALMSRSDLLLLDEPTNHLDLDAVIWLESWIQRYAGTLLLISHDRDFLNNCCTHIGHIENQRLVLYSGNYDAFEQARSEQLALQQSEYEKQQRCIRHMESFVSRFRAKATKARQAQSRLKALQRMQRIAPAHVDSGFRFSLLQPHKLPASLMKMEHANFAYGDDTILKDIDISILPGDRIGLLGANGAGKSTLIKLLAGTLQPASGKRQVSADTSIGYFAQQQVEQLHREHSPLQHLQQLDREAREADLRDYLGSFGFTGDMALTDTASFSGGERSRLVLAMLVYQRPNLLLLDEPTNHLDIEMREALAEALQDFDGAMVIVSHDRYLINATCDQLMLVDEQHATPFELSLDDYPAWLGERQRRQAAEAAPVEPSAAESAEHTRQNRKQQKQAQARHRELTSPLRKRLRQLESSMDETQHKLAELERQLADNTIYDEANRGRMQQLISDRQAEEKRFSEMEEAWLETSEELEQAEREADIQ